MTLPSAAKALMFKRKESPEERGSPGSICEERGQLGHHAPPPHGAGDLGEVAGVPGCRMARFHSESSQCLRLCLRRAGVGAEGRGCLSPPLCPPRSQVRQRPSPRPAAVPPTPSPSLGSLAVPLWPNGCSPKGNSLQGTRSRSVSEALARATWLPVSICPQSEPHFRCRS